MKIALTLPLISTSAERAFSKLKLVKSGLRTTMRHARKADKSNVILIMSIEGDLLDLDEENLVKAFINMPPRRMDLVYLFILFI